MTSVTYLDYSPGGRPFIAFLSGESRTALSFFPGTTWKKKAVARYLLLSDLLGAALPGVMFRSDIELFSTTINNLRQNLNEKYAIAGRSFLLMHNREYSRQRAYLWCFDDRKKLTAFVKVGLGDANRKDLQREADALLKLKNTKITFKVPKLLAFIKQNKMTVLVISPLPSSNEIDFNYLPWHLIEKHFIELKNSTTRKIAASQLLSLNWYQNFSSMLKSQTIMAINEFFMDKNVVISFIHGDMGSENSFLFKDRLWIVDWEKSTQDGPVATDEVAHWLGKTVKKNGLNRQLIDAFNTNFLFTGGNLNPDIFLALCYLKSVHFPPGEFVFDDFEKTFLAKRGK